MAETINIITWKWKGVQQKSGIEYSAEHVNILYAMIKRNLDRDFRLICVTDDGEGIRSEVIIADLHYEWQDMGGCYVRLNSFAKDFLGEDIKRFISIDLDVVIINDITSIFTRTEDFLIWGDPLRYTPYWGSFFMMDKGCRDQIYKQFNPKKTPEIAKQAGYKVGTDQAVISLYLYPKEVMLTKDDGLLNFVMHVKEMDHDILRILTTNAWKHLQKSRRPISHRESIALNHPTGELPDNAKIVFFNGKFDPCHKRLQNEYPFIKEHWHE